MAVDQLFDTVVDAVQPLAGQRGAALLGDAGGAVAWAEEAAAPAAGSSGPGLAGLLQSPLPMLIRTAKATASSARPWRR